MKVNQSNLLTLTTGFNGIFNKGMREAKPQWQTVATQVASNTKTQEYGFLGSFVEIMEWVDERHATALKQHGYTLTNKTFAGTVDVRREDIEDDQFGVYSPLLEELGRAVSIFPDRLVFGLLRDGTTGLCYDSQPFFSASHPVGKGVVSNLTAGVKPLWIMMDTTRALKPLIYQKRKEFKLVVKNAETDDSVFDHGIYRYGVDGRCNAGYGFWQMAHACTDTLDADAVKTVRAQMTALKGDTGDPLYVQPDLIVVGPSNQSAAEEIFLADRNAAGATNTLYKAVKILVSPFLD
ncbi:MAG: Mu-like prophage major head subunit gpT family protein [Nitrospirae bacterium]|nr:Mu-like prophage major head subunit gpT family protein [Magnetococcales bacterium]